MNELLIAKIFVVDSDGIRISQDSIEVHAPLIDANLEIGLNWQSPFENASADQKAPALVAMLQSGALIPFLKSAGLIDKNSDTSNMGSVESNIAKFKGRTGITKLNSTQIFTGMPPTKITGNLLFRAYRNAYEEVEKPFQKLMEWFLPQKLSSDSLIDRSAKLAKGDLSLALLPSEAPLLIGLQYKKRYYAPLVVESIGEPLTSPIGADGYYTELVVPVTFCSLSALDKDDMRSAMTAQPPVRRK